MYSLVTYKEVSDIRLVTGGVCSYDNNARQGSYFYFYFYFLEEIGPGLLVTVPRGFR